LLLIRILDVNNSKNQVRLLVFNFCIDYREGKRSTEHVIAPSLFQNRELGNLTHLESKEV
jgi:hypothetical protein